MIRAFLAIVLRDLRLHATSGGGLLLAPGFFALVATLFPLALNPAPATLRLIAPAVVWIGGLLAVLISLERIFGEDIEDGSLDGMALGLLPLSLVALAKALGHLIAFGLPLLLTAPLIALAYQLDAATTARLLASLLLGLPALTLIGLFAAALTAGLKRAGALIALIVVPLELPVLIFGVWSVAGPTGGGQTGLLYLALITLGALILLPAAVGAVLRLVLE